MFILHRSTNVIGFCSHFISLDVDISLSYTLCEHTVILEINIVRIEYMEKYLRDPSTNICTVQSMCQGPFALDDNDVNFLCRQKWVVWLRMALFTLDDKDKMMHCRCQYNPF